MTRGAFLKLEIPNLPYCFDHLENLHRGSSNQFWETLHVFNKKKQLQINIFWRNCCYSSAINNLDEGDVSVGIHDCKETNEWKQKTTIHENDKHFSQQKLVEVFKKIMY